MARWFILAMVCGATWAGNAPIAARAADDLQAVRFSELGSHAWPIRTDVPEAQAWFDQGLAFLYGFNHDEAIRAFARAAELDPKSPMPHWGIAYANGPNINYPLVDEIHGRAAWGALTKARELVANGSPLEQALIAALAERYVEQQPEDRRPLDEAFAAAMRRVWQAHPDHPDVGALFAESLMDLRPWDFWQSGGAAQPGTDEIVATLDAVLAMDPKHPLALHLYIHAVEASPQPQRAEVAADRLRDLQPGLGHMVHMPSHIDVRLGRWQEAIEANERAIAADAAYRAASAEPDFYRIYMAHNHHMLAFAAMMQGQSARATDAIAKMLAEMPPAWVQKNTMFVDAHHSMTYEVHLRFGRWNEMLAEPEPPENFPVTRAMRHYARGVAFAAQGQLEAARTEQSQFHAAKRALPEGTVFMLNTADAVLSVADKMLSGEILYREGQVDEAIEALREGVELEAQLRYTEPPDWILPVRHALGATLMDAGRFAEAEAVYRRDLEIHPHNGWSLFGLTQALRRQNLNAAADDAQERFDHAWRAADFKLTSSCCCLPAK